MITLITNLGTIELELDNENTPDTSANFKKYAEAGHYNNTIMHRVIPGFVVQGGGFENGMTQKKTRAPISNEAKKGIKNHRGTVAMARTGDPHSATSQFFINLKDNHFLDYTSETPQGWGYCVFAKVVKGLDIVDKMAQVATTTKSGHENVPVEDIIIEKVVVDEKLDA
ncbi:MAG: peptidyl-prolyl cis-trans isomerase [Gammaproteobacteria bacterium]|nr:peptidyl-prolyl cis-trans isomerase [Gammaproteobacteria bacterium]